MFPWKILFGKILEITKKMRITKNFTKNIKKIGNPLLTNSTKYAIM